MRPFQIVVDTNVLDSALRSRRGASFRLLSNIGVNTTFEINLSVPLVLEYEAVAKRHLGSSGLTAQDVDDGVDYMCSIANKHDIFFLWRPILKDPKDDMVLELAVAGNCDVIVTFNIKDLAAAEQFGIKVVGPRDFLREIGEIP